MQLSRREFTRLAFSAALFPSGLLRAEESPRARALVFVFLQGGPSQLDTFDPKPGAETGGPFKAIEAARGMTVCEHLPRLAKLGRRFSLVRTLHSRDPNHDTARYLIHTGYRADPTVEHPHLGCHLAQGAAGELPGAFALGSDGGAGTGYLPPETAPLLIEKLDAPLDALRTPPGVNAFRLRDRERLLAEQEREFARGRADPALASHRAAHERAHALIRSPRVRALDVTREPDAVRARYGASAFGRSCLIARRLLDEGVRFVEVALGDWDTHADNFNRSRALMGQLDEGLSALLDDLARSGRLEETLVVCAGEFGRTPRVNAAQGRDHWTRSFAALVAGGGLAGGRVVGRTDERGLEVVERPVAVQDLYATIYDRLGVDARREYPSLSGRPIKVLDGGKPIEELLA